MKEGVVRETALEAARFLVAHASERLSLADLADHVSYSPYHLARAFERELGLSPGQFLAAHRFQRAKELLLLTDDAVVDICFAVGFSSLGTFTRRFGAAVGSSPTGFRRLPDYLVAAPPEPLIARGPEPSGGCVFASVSLERAAMELLGRDPAIYVGLFPRPLAKGLPVAGALLGEPGPVCLSGLPPGTYWLLSSALAGRGDPKTQLVPTKSVTGASREPIHVTPSCSVHERAIVLRVAEPWAAPVLVALPPLASRSAQDWRRQGSATT